MRGEYNVVTKGMQSITVYIIIVALSTLLVAHQQWHTAERQMNLYGRHLANIFINALL